MNKRHAEDRAMRWDFEESSLHARLDAFAQRCKDLLEVCEAQRQFAPTTPLPVFGGSAGPMIAESFKGIQRDFQKLLDALRGLRYRVLDVKATSWPDDFNAFQSGVKDLEVQTQNVMTSAMDGAENLVARVEMLEALRSMAKLDAVVRCVERMTTECFDAFASELAAVKKHFDSNRENPPVDPQLPKHAGAAAWAMTQHARLKRPYDMLKEAATVLPPTPALEALQSSYALALPQIEKFARDKHAEWSAHVEAKVEPSMKIRLENRLLVTDDDGLLVMNFDRELMNLFTEVVQFERMRFQIPYKCAELASLGEVPRAPRGGAVGRERLQRHPETARREGTSAVPRSHPGARSTHRARSAEGELDQQQGDSRVFLAEATKHCHEAHKMVTSYKEAMARVRDNCATIASTSLVSILKKRGVRRG